MAKAFAAVGASASGEASGSTCITSFFWNISTMPAMVTLRGAFATLKSLWAVRMLTRQRGQVDFRDKN